VNTHLALVPVFREELGLSIELVGLMVTIPTLAQALLYLPFGMLSDRFQPRKLIGLSLFLVALGALIITQSRTPLMLVIGFSTIAVCLAIFHPPAYTIISDLFESGRRNVALGLHGSGGTLGMATGPISIGLVMYFLGESSWRVNYLIWAFPALGCLLAVMILKPRTASNPAAGSGSESPREELSLRNVFTRSYLLFLALVSIRNFGVQAVSTYMTTYLKDVRGMSVDYASILFGSISLMGVVAAPLGGILADRLGEKKVLLISYLGQAAMLVGIALSTSLFLLVPFVILYGLSEFLAMAPMSSLVAQFTPKGRRGIAYAAYFLPSTLVGAAAPVVGALVITAWGIWYVFPMSVLFFVAAATMVQLVLKKRRIHAS